MLSLTAAAQVDGTRFDGVDLFLRCRTPTLIRQMTSCGDWLTSCLAQTCGWIPGSARVAACRRRIRDGSARGARTFSRTGAKGLRASARSFGSLAYGKYGVMRIDSARARPNGRRIRQQTRSALPRHFARHAPLPKNTASDLPPRAKSAGAECTVGNATWNCWRLSIARRRWASRLTWRTPCSSRWATTRPRDRLLPRGFRLVGPDSFS